MPYKIIDLFSGAGGLTEGFRNDEFEIVSHIERDKAASETLKLRDCYHYLKKKGRINIYFQFLSGEISKEELFDKIPNEILDKTINKEISPDSLKYLFESIDINLSDNQKIAGVIGGPPCQAYSTIGRARNASKKETDERIYLYKYYIEFLKHYKPQFFVFENVKGLLSFKDTDGKLLFPKMKKEFEDIGYCLDYRIVNTQDYEIPQARERIIIFGVQEEQSSLINQFFEKLEELKTQPISLEEALSDLPKIKSGEEKNVYFSNGNKYIRKHYRRHRNVPLTQNIARPNISRDLKIYKQVVSAKEKGINLKYNELASELQTHKHTDKFLDRYKALSWGNPAHTVVAHIAKDGHHYIHPDKEQNRSITVREAARIQGFPDDYYFETSRTAAFTQIGNAVPPILSEKIAQIIEKLEF